MTQWSLFSINRTKYFSKPQAFAKVTYHGFFKCEGKCYPNTQLELCWKMLLFIIFYINFMFILFPYFQVLILFCLYFMSFYIILYFILTNRCYCCLFYWFLIETNYVCIIFCILTNRCYCRLFYWFLMENQLLLYVILLYILLLHVNNMVTKHHEIK